MKRHDFKFSLYDDNLNLSKDFIKKIKKIKLTSYDFNSNSFYSKEEEEKLKKLIYLEINSSVYKILRDLEYSDFSIVGAWIQKYTKKGNFHDCHIHDPYQYSFIIYVDCSNTSSETIFYNPGYPLFSTSSIRVTPKKGRFIFFNGAIPHGVLPNFDTKRLIVSGNIKLIK